MKKKKKLSSIFELRYVILPLALLFIFLVCGLYFFFGLPTKSPDFHQRFPIFFDPIAVYIAIGVLVFLFIVSIVNMGILRRLEIYESKRDKNKQEIASLKSELSELHAILENKDFLKSKMAGKRAEIDAIRRQVLKIPWIYRFVARKFGYIEE